MTGPFNESYNHISTDEVIETFAQHNKNIISEFVSQVTSKSVLQTNTPMASQGNWQGIEQPYTPVSSQGNTQENNVRQLVEDFFKGICSIVSEMRFYQEEGRMIPFRLSFGLNAISQGNTDLNSLPYRYNLYETKVTDIYKDTIGALKKVLSLCQDNTDVYIFLNSLDGDMQIEAGLYFLDLGNAQRNTIDFLNNGYILAECIPNNRIIFTLKEDIEDKFIKYEVKLDLGDKESSPGLEMIYDYEENKPFFQVYWNDIFARIRRNCHGTICLIVKPSFDLNSLSGLIVNERIIQISNIKLSPNKFGENDSVKLDQMLQIFFGALNFDGFSIIDTNGRLISYNNICIINSVKTSGGGSRHKAYETMKEWGDNNTAESGYLGDSLVGIYFQSQEGEIEYYDYKTKKTRINIDTNVFYQDKESQFGHLKNQIKNIKAIENVQFGTESFEENWPYDQLMGAIQNLLNVHSGIDNFINEKPASEILLSYFEHPEWSTYINYQLLGDTYVKLRKKALDAVLTCLVGNYYGYSRAAELILINILEHIPTEWIHEYFQKDKRYYLSPCLINELGSEKPYWRWKTTVKTLITKRLKERTVPVDDTQEIIDAAYKLSSNDFYDINMYYYHDTDIIIL